MLSKTVLPLLFLAFSAPVLAQTVCSSANAVPLESIKEDTSSVGGVTINDGFADKLQGYEDTMDRIGQIGKRTLNKRDPTCTATEICFSVAKVPLCINPLNGDYHADGETGNIVSGDYVDKDGRKGNFISELSSIAATATNKQSSPTKSPDAAANAASTTSSGNPGVGQVLPTSGTGSAAVPSPTQSTTGGGAVGLQVGLGGVGMAALVGLVVL